MEIKFNLKDAEPYLPFGRLINLKDKLRLSEISFTEDEVKNASSSVRDVNWQINLKAVEGELAYRMQGSLNSAGTIIKDSIKREFSKTIVNETVYAEALHNLTEKNRSEIEGVFQNIINTNSRAKELIAKIKKLKAVNGN